MAVCTACDEMRLGEQRVGVPRERFEQSLRWDPERRSRIEAKNNDSTELWHRTWNVQIMGLQYKRRREGDDEDEDRSSLDSSSHDAAVSGKDPEDEPFPKEALLIQCMLQ